MNLSLLDLLKQQSASGKKQLAVLIDPDKADDRELIPLVTKAQKAGADYFFVGGSLLTSNQLDAVLNTIREISDLPTILFPGGVTQISSQADGMLLLSLISGRNPEFLIGAHVVAAPMLRQSGIQLLPTGYMLIDGGRPTTVSYISNTTPIPADKADIAACTAMAGEMLGLQLIYMDAGSGALHPIPQRTIQAVKAAVNLPVIVGGGIREAGQAEAAFAAGADVVVVGNALEDRPEFMEELARVKHMANLPLQA